MRIRRHWLWLFLLIPMLIGAARLRLDVEVLNLLPARSRAVQGLQLYNENFANARELIISVSAPDAETAEIAARTLAEELRLLDGLVAAVTWQPPWLEYPGQSAELIAHLWFNQPPEVFATLTERLNPVSASATLAATREALSTTLSPGDLARLGYDPFNLSDVPGGEGSGAGFAQGDELFASTDGTLRILFVQATDDLRSYRACKRWLETVQKQVDGWALRNGVENAVKVRFTGRPAFVAEIAGGMERDMTVSIGGTLLVIALLFWIAHRSWRPLLWLVALLSFILGGTLALGGLFFGTLNVVSAGFAAILLGLSVDYALVLYQEHRAQLGLSAAQLRRKIGPSIVWSALTTAGAFSILNLCGLPGLGQLGSLVALGVVLAATVMLFWFLPPLLRAEGKGSIVPPAAMPGPVPPGLLRTPIVWGLTVLGLLTALIVLPGRSPGLDHTPDALRPRQSDAYAALEEIKTRMQRTQEPLWLIVSGSDEATVAARLDGVVPALEQARESRAISHFTLPHEVWPRPEHQRENRATARTLIAHAPALREAALAQGFAPESLALTEQIIATWERAADGTEVFWPTNVVSRWVLEKFVARTSDGFLVLGLVHPAGAHADTSALERALPDENVWLAGWEQLGRAILEVVQRDLWRVLVPMGGLLLLTLGLAFRRATEVALSLATMGFSALGLWTVMALFGWSWNLMNLMALPLLLGAGVDYSLHMQLALRRHGGDVTSARRIVGRALLLCAATTVTGFGSLAWSGNAGLASLGQVCAAGVAITAVTAVFLLPGWWKSLTSSHSSVEAERLRQPSSLYRAELWKLALWTVGVLPPAFAAGLSRCLARFYWRISRSRREVVVQNILPALGGDRPLAVERSRQLFEQFGTKLVDLLRYESGRSVDDLFAGFCGWEHFEAARKRGTGILLLTPHLGNWELGAPLLAARGVSLLVITLHEPDAALTALRQESRARWGIETLVIGADPFAFVEVIRRLEAGETVALLVDRPPAASAVSVTLFGRPFAASIAAAELARASGCALLPVYLPRGEGGYAAHLLPEIGYDRQALGKREARQRLTQEIISTFEPIIQKEITQWYHFVPLWPR